MRLPNAILGFSPLYWAHSKAKRQWVELWEDEICFWTRKAECSQGHGADRRADPIAGRQESWAFRRALNINQELTVVDEHLRDPGRAHPHTGSYSTVTVSGWWSPGGGHSDVWRPHTYFEGKNYLSLSNWHKIGQKLCNTNNSVKNKLYLYFFNSRAETDFFFPLKMIFKKRNYEYFSPNKISIYYFE